MTAEVTQSGMIKPTLIEQFIILRKRKGWTQEQAAKKLGVTVRCLRSWEQTERKPKPIVARVMKQFIEEAAA